MIDILDIADIKETEMTAEQKIREAFEQAKYEWEAHDDWRYADREACWLFFVRAGYLALLNELEFVTKLETQQFDCFKVSFEDSKKLKVLPVGSKLIVLPLVSSEE